MGYLRSQEGRAESNVNCGGVNFRGRTIIVKGVKAIIVIFWQRMCLLIAIAWG